MLRWVAVSLDRWELRDGSKKLGALIKLKSSWPTGYQFAGDTWAPLPRGPYKNYLQAQKNVRLAALDLEFHLGVNSSGVLDRYRKVA